MYGRDFSLADYDVYRVWGGPCTVGDRSGLGRTGLGQIKLKGLRSCGIGPGHREKESGHVEGFWSGRKDSGQAERS